MNTLNVLWTGGLDSTYLFVKLATTTTVIIQPYYVLDEGRKSVPFELRAIERIFGILKADKNVTAELKDIIIIKKSSLAQDKTITEAWKRLNKVYALGSQYDFLARMAKQYNLQLAVGVLFSDRDSRVVRAIEDNSELTEGYIGEVPFLTVENEEINDTITIFENILFPSFMRDIEKTDEWKELCDMGYSNIANMTWFCHNPVFGMPCGHCNPCKDALAEGMAFRVPIMGRILYYVQKIKNKITK